VIIDWINVGKVSAERDENLSHYFYDNGVLKKVINDTNAFLILGRKGAGKTAVFKYFSDNKQDLVDNPEIDIQQEDLLIPLSFEDYNWNIHSLLNDKHKAESLAYKQSWRFVIFIECIKAHKIWFEERGLSVPKELQAANKLLEKLFDSPIPSISQIVGRKLLSLSGLTMPKGGLSLEDGEFDGVELEGGSVQFNEIEKNTSLQQKLSENIENLINYLDKVLFRLEGGIPKIFICFDRIDEAWDDISFDSSKRVIAGLVSAGNSITEQYNGKIRPIVFLREDIFDELNLNDKNKLRQDCGALLHWSRDSLVKMMQYRINYYARIADIPEIQSLEVIFEDREMRQRAKPLNHILKRTMMRPRDFISIIDMTIKSMKDTVEDPFSENDELENMDVLGNNFIYAAEAGYSEWLFNEIIDEWKVQKPIIKQLFNAIQNNISTVITEEELKSQLLKLRVNCEQNDVNDYIKFLYDNSIIGFKVGDSTQWRYKCFYPSQGFLDSTEYKVHDGLVSILSLKEKRSVD
jgi:hypothetical protein